jgi:serine/threonine-protein kinase RsbT
VQKEIRVYINDENSIFSARNQILEFLKEHTLDANKLKVTELLTVISELARNMYQYSNGGVISVSITGKDKDKIKMIFSDTGEGFDAEAVLAGKAKRHGLGIGLSGRKKLCDTFFIRSGHSGTMISCTKTMK